MPAYSFFGPTCVQSPFNHITHYDVYESGCNSKHGERKPLIINGAPVQYIDNKNHLSQLIASKSYGAFTADVFAALMGRVFDIVPFYEYFFKNDREGIPHTFRLCFAHFFMAAPLLLDSLTGLLNVPITLLSDSNYKLTIENKNIENTFWGGIKQICLNLHKEGNIIRFALQSAALLMLAVCNLVISLVSSVLKVTFAIVAFIPAMFIGTAAKLICNAKYPSSIYEVNTKEEKGASDTVEETDGLVPSAAAIVPQPM
jgi:hypothetical protein